MKRMSAAVIGFGDRSEIYSKYSLAHPEELKITAVVEPDAVRRNLAKKLFDIPDGNCFCDVDSFIKKGKLADFVINGTMDNLHIKTTLPLLPLGYDVLLEKPITSDKKELLELMSTSKLYNNKIVVCHVLRYAPFYDKIKQLIHAGDIGKVRHIETAENVGVAHASVSYIRGKWNKKSVCGSSYLLAKCCHDTDLLCWLNSGTIPVKVASMGSRNYFIAQNAPEGAGTRCLNDCPHVDTCAYSAKSMHLDNNPIPLIVWRGLNKLPGEVTMQERINSLKTDNPHGACIFKTDADLIDQQSVMVGFDNGSTACHLLFSSAMRAGRRIKVYGTKGEIEGFTEDNFFVVRHYNPDNILYIEKTVKITEAASDDGHHGGDSRIVADFLKVLRGEKPSLSTSRLEDSVNSHLIVYAADESMEKDKFIFI